MYISRGEGGGQFLCLYNFRQCRMDELTTILSSNHLPFDACNWDEHPAAAGIFFGLDMSSERVFFNLAGSLG